MNLLKWIAGIVHFKKRKNGVIGIIPGADGPTAIYYKINKEKSAYHKGNIKKKIIVVIASLCIIFVATFFASRYGWRLFGFRYCSEPSMICVEHITINSNDDFVRIVGNTYASAPAFIGATYKLDGDTLYVGMKYNLLFGFFNRDGGFDIQIPIDTKDIEKIVIKGNQAEETIWEKGGPKLLSDQELSLGVYISMDELSAVILQDNNEFISIISPLNFLLAKSIIKVQGVRSF